MKPLGILPVIGDAAYTEMSSNVREDTLCHWTIWRGTNHCFCRPELRLSHSPRHNDRLWLMNYCNTAMLPTA